MSFLGRALLVSLVVCFTLGSARSEAAPILLGDLGEIGSTPTNFEGELIVAADIGVFSFSLSEAAFLSFNVSSHICDDPDVDTCGIIPTFSFFFGDGLDDITALNFFAEVGFDLDRTSLLLEPLFPAGSYLLAVTLFPNVFEPDPELGAFTSELDPNFLAPLERELPSCVGVGFVQPGALDLECRSGAFAGSFSAVPEEIVPEPGTLFLMGLGGAALFARGRRRVKRGVPLNGDS